MKHLERFWMHILLALFTSALVACGTPPAGVSSAQNVLNLASTSCKDLGAAIAATDQAVLQGAISKKTAQEALKGFTAAQAGCVAALGTIQAAQPAASGVSK